LRQTFKNYKIILVDDYSTDNTQQLIKQFEELHKNIINSVYLSEKKHAGGARNKGLEFYNDSEYTLFLDSDDYYLNDKSLEHLYSTIVFNNYPELIKCGY
jgi:glycosyltransferase involved in cell wall biosynthesis